MKLTQNAPKTLLARQAIFNRKKMVCAYELLYRNNTNSANMDSLNANPLSGDAATSSVITQVFANLDINNILGNKPAYINFTYNHLIEQVPLLLPKERVIIEVLETVIIDKPLIQSLKQMSLAGYRIALDDFMYREEIIPLIKLANVIKIDVINLSKIEIAKHIAPLNNLFKGKLLAEKIETKSQFDHCMELGFDYFQGFFLNRPDPFTGHHLTENKAHLLQILAELNNADVALDQIAEQILNVPKLSYRILRLTNSVAFYNGKKIESLMDAIMQLGLLQIRNWIILLMLASSDDVDPDLLERTLIRAKMCESLAKSAHYANPHQAFTVGILSTLDAIFNEPLASLLAKTQLSEVLNAALLHHVGYLGNLLKCTISYEEANFKQLQYCGISDEDLLNAYLDAIAFANSVMTGIHS